MTKRNYSAFTWLALAAIGIFLTGCASEVVPATSHKPTSAAMVKIYPKAPQKYEKLGLISIPVSEEMKWDDHAHSKVGFERMKQQAAAMGANGVLLMVDKSDFEVYVTVGDGENYYQVPMKQKPKTLIAEAIYDLK